MLQGCRQYKINFPCILKFSVVNLNSITPLLSSCVLNSYEKQIELYDQHTDAQFFPLPYESQSLWYFKSVTTNVDTVLYLATN